MVKYILKHLKCIICFIPQR